MSKLDQILGQKRAEKQARVEAEKAERQRKQDEHDRALLDAFEAKLRGELGDVFELLNLVSAQVRDDRNTRYPLVVISDENVQWVVSGNQREVNIRKPGYRMYAKAQDSGTGYTFSIWDEIFIPEGELADQLLAAMGEARAALEDRARKQDEARRKAEARLEHSRLILERERAERDARIAAEQAEDDAARVELKARVETLKAQQWQWPEGATLTLYRVRYCTGSDSEGGFDYESGWTSSDALDDSGWINVTAYNHSRALRLFAWNHPYFERHNFGSVEDLPHDLKVTPRCEVAGLEWGSGLGSQRILRRDPNSSVNVDLDPEPVEWVKKLLG